MLDSEKGEQRGKTCIGYGHSCDGAHAGASNVRMMHNTSICINLNNDAKSYELHQNLNWCIIDL